MPLENEVERGFKQIACEILDISTRSYSNFSKQKRPIIKLLEKYFTKEDIEEFLEAGKIKSQERSRGYKFITYHYFNIFIDNLEEFINPKVLINDKHPLVIFFDFIDDCKLDSKKNSMIFDYEYVLMIEKMYTVFVIDKSEPINVKKLLDIDMLILAQITCDNISVEEILKNSKISIYYLFYNVMNKFKEELNLKKYLLKNNLTFWDVHKDEVKKIKNQNIDFFIESFNDAYLNMNEFKKKYNDKNLEQEKLDIVNMIIKELELFKS